MAYPSRHATGTLFIGLCVLLASRPIWAQETFPTAIHECQKLIESQEYEGALAAVDKAKQLAGSEAEHVTAFLHEGIALFELGRKQRQSAEGAFLRGLPQEPPWKEMSTDASGPVHDLFEDVQSGAASLQGSTACSASAPEFNPPPAADNEQRNLGTVLRQFQESFGRQEYAEALRLIARAKEHRPLHEEQCRTVALYEGVLLASLWEHYRLQAELAFQKALRLNAGAQFPPPRFRSKGKLSEMTAAFTRLRDKVTKAREHRATLLRADKARWISTGNMAKARERHTATLLGSGKVLVVGGVNTEGALSGAELYDPTTATWTPTDSMSVPRYRHTATLLSSGKVLVTGGENDDHGVLSSAELYDPATGTWSPAAGMNTGRHHHTATLLDSGKVLAAGGEDASGESISKAELYDPSTGLWADTGGLSNQRVYHAAIKLKSGKVLVMGGVGAGSALPCSELYDPVSGTWSSPPGGLPKGISDHEASLLLSEKVLVTGGYDGERALSMVAIYDPVAGTWNGGTSTADMSTGRTGHTATVLSSGKVLVVGGEGTEEPVGGSAEVYDATTGTWLPTASMSLARIGHTATRLPSGGVLIAGGISDDDTALSSAEVYLP